MDRLRQRQSDERRWRRSTLLAGVGDGVVATTLALLTAGLSRDPLAVATVFAAQHLPWAVVATAWGSAWVDADRRTVLGLGVTIRAVAVAVVGLSVLAGTETIVVLVVAALAVGLGEALADQAEAEAYGSGLDLGCGSGGHALVGLAVIGLPLGGLAYELAAALPFLVNVGVFALAALAALTLRAPWPGARPWRAHQSGQVPPVGLAGALASGTAPVTTVAALSTFAGSATLGVLVLFALDDLGLGAPGFGLLLAGLAGSSAMGAWMAPTIGRVLGLRAGLVVALAMAGAGYVAAGLAADPTRPLVGAAALGAGAAGSMAAAVLARVLVHTGAGRVVEGQSLVAFHVRVWGAIPSGALIGGVVAKVLGVPALVVASGLVSGLAAALSVAMVSGRVKSPGTTVPKDEPKEKIG